MKIYTFLLINFIVGFISDIILNDLSRSHNPDTIIGSLQDYFKDKGIIEAGIYAGLTIVVAVLMTIFVTRHIFRMKVPYSFKKLVYFSVIGYAVGYILDVVIEKLEIFGDTLDKYYKTAGSGHWGAIAFVFAMTVSYIIEKNIVPLL